MVAATAASQHAPASDSADLEGGSRDLITLRDCISIASLIANGPTWNVDGDIDDVDAQWLIDVAHALQQLDPEDVERALTVYSARLPDEWRRIAELHTPDPWTHPVVLIRVMIDVSEEPMTLEQRNFLVDRRIALGSGFGAMRPSGERTDFEQSAAFPVIWRDGRPHVAAGRAIGLSLAGISQHEVYDPAREFRVLRQWHGYRRLDHLASPRGARPVPWRDCEHAQSRSEQPDDRGATRE